MRRAAAPLRRAANRAPASATRSFAISSVPTPNSSAARTLRHRLRRRGSEDRRPERRHAQRDERQQEQRRCRDRRRRASAPAALPRSTPAIVQSSPRHQHPRAPPGTARLTAFEVSWVVPAPNQLRPGAPRGAGPSTRKREELAPEHGTRPAHPSTRSSGSCARRRRSGVPARTGSPLRLRERRRLLAEEGDGLLPGVGGVVGTVGRTAVVVDEAVVGALVAHDGDAGRLGRGHVRRRVSTGRRCRRWPSPDRRSGGRTASSGSIGALALPVIRHLEHPVERHGPVKASGAHGLQREHAAHAEARDADRRRPRAGRPPRRRRRGTPDRRSCRPAAADRRAAGPRARATARRRPRPSRCSSASRWAWSSNSGRSPMMSGISTNPRDGARPSAGVATSTGVPEGSVLRMSAV